MANHSTSGAPSVWTQLLRSSDRLMTPMTASVALICFTVFALAVIAGCLIGPSYGIPAERVLDTTWKVLSGFGTLASAFYLRGQRQQASRTEAGLNQLAKKLPTDA